MVENKKGEWTAGRALARLADSRAGIGAPGRWIFNLKRGAFPPYDLSGREGAKMLREFMLRAGGRADFRSAIAEAGKWKPDLLIYLTDLEGDADDEPASPVL